MYFYGIGIYERSEELKRIKAVQHSVTLFAKNDLEELETKTIRKLPIDKSSYFGFYHEEHEGEHHYVQVKDNVMMAISSRKPLMKSECYYLFINIHNTLKHPEAVTLEQIIKNPLGYINRDVCDKIAKVEKKVAETKDTMMSAIEAALNRGEKIDSLSEKAEALAAHSKDFKNKAQKLNSCCR